jgi:hypothetical protein
MDQMIPLAVGGTILSGAGQIASGVAANAQGASQQAASNYSASVLRQKAGQELAVASNKVAPIKLATDYALSNERAAAAGMGGTASSPTAQTIAGQIAARGEYNALSTLYSGNEAAAGLENQADLDVVTGKAERIAGQQKMMGGITSGLGSMISGGAGLYAKYGMPLAAANDATDIQTKTNNLFPFSS